MGYEEFNNTKFMERKGLVYVAISLKAERGKGGKKRDQGAVKT